MFIWSCVGMWCQMLGSSPWLSQSLCTSHSQPRTAPHEHAHEECKDAGKLGRVRGLGQRLDTNHQALYLLSHAAWNRQWDHITMLLYNRIKRVFDNFLTPFFFHKLVQKMIGWNTAGRETKQDVLLQKYDVTFPLLSGLVEQNVPRFVWCISLRVCQSKKVFYCVRLNFLQQHSQEQQWERGKGATRGITSMMSSSNRSQKPWLLTIVI